MSLGGGGFFNMTAWDGDWVEERKTHIKPADQSVPERTKATGELYIALNTCLSPFAVQVLQQPYTTTTTTSPAPNITKAGAIQCSGNRCDNGRRSELSGSYLIDNKYRLKNTT